MEINDGVEQAELFPPSLDEADLVFVFEIRQYKNARMRKIVVEKNAEGMLTVEMLVGALEMTKADLMLSQSLLVQKAEEIELLRKSNYEKEESLSKPAEDAEKQI